MTSKILQKIDPNTVTLLEYFLISAVTSVLLIRFFLFITNYPQLGGNGLHIAHMLWGGLFMFIAILLALISLNNKLKLYIAILGGIGFGTFIDELGKFITSDNNYFFEPTIAIIYTFFIAIFLLIKFFEANLGNLKQKQVEKINPIPISKFIYKIVANKFVSMILIIYFIINLSIQLFLLIIFLLNFKNNQVPTIYYIQLFAIGLSSLLFVVSLIKYFQNKTAEFYKILIYICLIAIFIIQVFQFLDNQLNAIFALLINILIYFALKIRLQNITLSSNNSESN